MTEFLAFLRGHPAGDLKKIQKVNKRALVLSMRSVLTALTAASNIKKTPALQAKQDEHLRNH